MAETAPPVTPPGMTGGRTGGMTGGTPGGKTGGASGGVTGGVTGGVRQVVGAHELAGADIVLTTYDVLRCDLAHEEEERGERKLRYRKR